MYKLVSASEDTRSSSDPSYKQRIFDEPAVKSEVTARVSKLSQMAQEWFVKIARLATVRVWARARVRARSGCC